MKKNKALAKLVFKVKCHIFSPVGHASNRMCRYYKPLLIIISPAYLIALFSFVLLAGNNQYVLKKISMDMYTRTTHGGKMSVTKAEIYYNSEGRMVSMYSEPDKIYISNTKKGDVIVYNFRDNTVLQRQNYLFSTENNQLYFFLENNKTDLGLGRMGFKITDTKFENGLKITTWIPMKQMQDHISKVELVHKKNNPVFLGYYNSVGKFQKKVYFYGYEKYYGVSLPTKLTQISFTTPNDSIVSKTVYSNVKLDDQVSDDGFNFIVPPSAVPLK